MLAGREVPDSSCGMPANADMKPISFYMPADLLEKVKREARKEGRSASSQVRIILTKSLATKKTAKQYH